MRSLLIALILLVGCDMPPPQPPVQKVIVENLASTEQRLGVDVFDSKSMVRTRAESVYYLIAEDRTMVKVPLRQYVRTKVGQSFISNEWK